MIGSYFLANLVRRCIEPVCWVRMHLCLTERICADCRMLAAKAGSNGQTLQTLASSNKITFADLGQLLPNPIGLLTGLLWTCDSEDWVQLKGRSNDFTDAVYSRYGIHTNIPCQAIVLTTIPPIHLLCLTIASKTTLSSSPSTCTTTLPRT